MDESDKCVEVTKNPQFCASLYKINWLINSLAECMWERGRAEECFQECLKVCRGEECEVTCLGALEVATGTVVAHLIARRAIQAANPKGSGLMESIASAFKEELESAKAKECPDKAVTARILSTAAVELFMNMQKAAEGFPNLRKLAEDLLLLTAPALAEAYQCAGDEAFEYLEVVRPLIGEETTKRIVAALEEGSVLVGGVDFKFKPVKTSQ
jgi:hypothetical protein